MEQLGMIAIFIVIIVVRAFVQPRKLIERAKNQPFHPVVTKKQQIKPLQSNEPVRGGYQPVRGRAPVSAYQPRSAHGEDSIEHNHWEPASISSSHDVLQEQPGLDGAKDTGRIHADDKGSVPPGSISAILPELNAQGIVRAVIMHEILGAPRSRQRF